MRQRYCRPTDSPIMVWTVLFLTMWDIWHLFNVWVHAHERREVGRSRKYSCRISPWRVGVLSPWQQEKVSWHKSATINDKGFRHSVNKFTYFLWQWDIRLTSYHCVIDVGNKKREGGNGVFRFDNRLFLHIYLARFRNCCYDSAFLYFNLFWKKTVREVYPKISIPNLGILWYCSFESTAVWHSVHCGGKNSHWVWICEHMCKVWRFTHIVTVRRSDFARTAW